MVFTNIRFLSTNICILFCFCSKVGFLYTNIGILFLFYQHCIALHQYRYIIFSLPMLDSSIPFLVNYFPFTNTGFIYTNIGIIFIRNINVLYVKSITLTSILCVRCSFWQFLPFKACFTITVIPSSFDRNNSDGKASLKQQKPPETTRDTGCE